VEINVTAGQATDDNMHCMLEILRYKNTLTVCNSFCLSTATLFPRTSLNITLYVHSVSWYNICKLRFLPTLSVCAGDAHKNAITSPNSINLWPLQLTQNSFSVKQDLLLTRISWEYSILVCSVRTAVVKSFKRSCRRFLDKETKLKNWLP